MLAVMAELLAGDDLLARAEAAEHAITQQISTQYLRAARVGERVQVHATLLRRTRALAFVSVTALGAGGDGPASPQGPDHEVGRGVLSRVAASTNPIVAATRCPTVVKSGSRPDQSASSNGQP